MKPEMKKTTDIVGRYWPSAPHQKMEADGARVLQRLRDRTARATAPSSEERPAFFRWGIAISAVAAVLARRSLVFATIAAAIAIAILFPAGALRSAPAVLEGPAGSRNVQYGEVVRDGMLKFPGGARVEIQPESQVLLEHANDGVRLSLQKGNVVAVVSGEARLQQGATNRTLRAGEQVRTNPSEQPPQLSFAMASIVISTESAASPVVPPVEVREAFDVISIRPAALSIGGSGLRGAGRGGGARSAGGRNPAVACGGTLQLDPSRLMVTSVSLYRLINLAYGRNCRASVEQDLLTGEPDWLRRDLFDIQATLPQGTPVYTLQELQNGTAHVVQRMMQNMLADRFKLTLDRSSKEVPTYNLTLVRMDKIRLSADQTPPGSVPPPQPGVALADPPLRGELQIRADPQMGTVMVAATAIPMSTFITYLQGGVWRFVVDKTEMKGLYDFPREFYNVGPYEVPAPPEVSVWPEVLSRMGFKVETARGPVEVLVISGVQKPSEN